VAEIVYHAAILPQPKAKTWKFETDFCKTEEFKLSLLRK
jgi:hypothetical protein